jgi:simple sugar transport system permease protein
MIELFGGILYTALLAGGVIALGALGEVLAERVGVFNLGLEGLMGVGAITGIVTVAHYPVPVAGLLAAFLAGIALGVLFAFATVVLAANQTLCGLALTIMGNGLSAAIGRGYSGMPAQAVFAPVRVPLLSDIPIIGHAIFTQSPLVYVIWIALPLAIHWLFYKTRHGIHLRAVGENPAAADAVGIPVLPIRFFYTVLGAGIGASAGAYLTLAFIPGWSAMMVGGRGWIALALVIFAGYRPLNIVAGALLFGIVTSLGFVGEARNWPMPPALLSMLPYIATVALMILRLLASQRSRGFEPPAALGIAFNRAER